MIPQLDKRLNAYRDDLADASLQGEVKASRFVEGAPMRVLPHSTDMLREPLADAGLDTQVLHGHDVTVFDQSDGWAWVQRQGDGYVGYIRENDLGVADDTCTHMVSVPRTFLYPGPDLKLPRCGYRSMGSKLVVIGEKENRGTRYAMLKTGEAVVARHLIALGSWKTDYVAVAEQFLHTPYLWGGDTGFGIDCSGLIFLSNMLCGKTVLRDSDMQATSIGDIVETNDFRNLQRGDLIFWKGHVGIIHDSDHLLHANGHTMDTAIEPLSEAIERIRLPVWQANPRPTTIEPFSIRRQSVCESRWPDKRRECFSQQKRSPSLPAQI